jgi:endogenous inhibitor of DNA gyrase (YacG/DUF329 family)
MSPPAERKPRPCPRCGRPSDGASFPFCSDRCRLLDLSAWLDEVYAIPAEEPPREPLEDEELRTIH